MTSYESAILLAKALDSKKGQDIKVLRTEGLTTLADYFVICTAGSSTQIKAMSDACEETMEKHGEQAHHERDATAVDDACQVVAAELVGTKPVLGAGGGQAVRHVGGVGGQRQQRRDVAHHDDDEQKRQRNDGALVALEGKPRGLAARHVVLLGRLGCGRGIKSRLGRCDALGGGACGFLSELHYLLPPP